jgi:hypothetical protein
MYQAELLLSALLASHSCTLYRYAAIRLFASAYGQTETVRPYAEAPENFVKIIYPVCVANFYEVPVFAIKLFEIIKLHSGFPDNHQNPESR